MNMNPNRRKFLAKGTGGLLVLRPQTVFGSQANSAIEIGIVRAGGRGNWIADLFIEHVGARVVAIAEPFEDRRRQGISKYKLDSSHAYGGRDGHLQLAASKLDVVAIESPPYFHPEQAEAAVAAGKHVFLAKPVAVDVDGCKRIMAAGAKAKGKLSFLVDSRPGPARRFRKPLVACTPAISENPSLVTSTITPAS
jgi:predicted dehydrogenase